MSIEWNKVTRVSQVVTIVLFVIVFALGFWMGMQYQPLPKEEIGIEEELVACTMDAKICPDGSSVGRVGPNCSFAPCLGE